MGAMKTKSNAKKNDSERDSSADNYEIKLTPRFIFLTMLGITFLSFGVGRYGVGILIRKFHLPTTTSTSASLPAPAYPVGKEVPHTIYTSKNYDTGVEATSESLLARRGVDFVITDPIYDAEAKGEELHEPAGQHLLIDIKSVDGSFLDSVHRLAGAMVELVSLSGLTMLSYHCHDLIPVGVSCVGVLLESHISFHTWPIAGVITLDLFTCGPDSLLPHLPTIERLFAVPRLAAVPGAEVEKPHIQWSYKKRGFKLNSKSNPEDVDMQQFLLGWFEFDLKEIVASEKTDFQTVEIFDVISRRMRDLQAYKMSLKKDGSYESQNPDLFRPDRIVYLDGIMQSRLFGESAYHEALVHPAMVTHDNPKRVAIIGGGEGATLREVLKYQTVEKAVMVEIDQRMVELSIEHLPEWNSCDFLEGGDKSCFDDPRAEVYFEDAIAWFISRYLNENSEAPKFDVIIMDALNNDMTRALSNALGEDGILVAQTGEASSLNDPSFGLGQKEAGQQFMMNLFEGGFQTFAKYEEGECGFMAPWSYMIAFKNRKSYTTWHQNQADVDAKLHQRAKRTVNGDLPFYSFDGATMMGYQYPSRIEEEVHCKSGWEECAVGHGFQPERLNAQLSSFELRDQGLFAKEDLAAGSYVAADEAVHSLVVNPATMHFIEKFSESSLATDQWGIFDSYLKSYSFGNSSLDVGSLGPIRHSHSSHAKNETKLETKGMAYSPFQQRNSLVSAHSDVMLNDVKAGEEISWDQARSVMSVEA